MSKANRQKPEANNQRKKINHEINNVNNAFKSDEIQNFISLFGLTFK